MNRVLLFAATTLLLGCSVDPFTLQARASTVCQRLPAQRFQVPTQVREQYALLPQAMQSGVELQRSFVFDVRPELPPEAEAILDAHFALTSVRLTTVDPADHLGFLEEAHVSLQPQSGSGLAPRVFDYVRSEPEPRTVAWNGEAFELTDYVASGTIAYSVSLVGSLPPGDVVVDVEACAEVAVKVDL